ncbi:choline BCCT transporter BetT [Gordonia sp. CPCC 205333]|uniref:choline BCCT transporter BetT n=1 Tax=Gordonia sp. CPCC 205333 TaxID=3140790 RepID=UPI003AF39815
MSDVEVPTTSPPPHSDDETPSTRWQSVNLRVFITAAAIVLALAIWALLAPGSADRVISNVVTFITEWFGWWYFVLATAVVAVVLFIAISRYGKIRLGPDESRPEYSLFTWTAMLFAAGIGIDLMFFSVAEPVSQYLTPPVGPGETNAAAAEAVTWTLFHYGVSGWAMYALMGAALAYFAFRKNLPLTIRSVLYPIIGKRVHGAVGDTIDVAAVLGTIFGIATSLGIGIVQLAYGLHTMFGMSQGKATQIGLIVLSVIIATASATSGVDRGIRRLSELNVILSVVLLIYILVTGKTSFLLNALVMNTGDYVSTFADRTLNTMAWDAPTDWLNLWTLFFWAWWVAWTPFVGLFLARISRGRTVRQFVAGVLTVPFGFILLWVSIFGNSALDVARGDKAFAQTTATKPEQGFYDLLEKYPGAPLLLGIATITGLLYYVTSADSGALVMGNFTSRLRDPLADCSKANRIFWSCAIGLLTLAMLFAGANGSILTLQKATIIMGLPFSFVLALVGFALLRALRQETVKTDSYRSSLPKAIAAGRPSGGDGALWRRRLLATLQYPGAGATKKFLESTVTQAMMTVADELRRSSVDASVSTAVDENDLPTPKLTIGRGSSSMFRRSPVNSDAMWRSPGAARA